MSLTVEPPAGEPGTPHLTVLSSAEDPGARQSGASEVREVRGAGGLKSAGAALDVLGLLTQESELGVSDVARRLGIAKSTAHRLLTTLRLRGLVEPNPETGQYRLGLRLCELGNLARDRHPVRQAILQHLVELRRTTGLPVRVSVPDGTDVVHVDHLSAASAAAVLEQLPGRLPLHRTAGGLAICAFNDDVAEERRCKGFEPGGTITTVEAFDEILEQIRRDGVAVQSGAAAPGVTTIGSPIRNHLGVAYMAVGIAAPSGEAAPALDRLGRLVVVAANRIARSALPVVADGDALFLPDIVANLGR